MASAREEAGTGAGGRKTLEGAIGDALVALTRLPSGSAAFGSAGLGSTGDASAGFIAASTGRGRGNGPAGAKAAAGIGTTEPNIGDGWRPACRKSALAMMALTAANASAPATMSFGLYSKMRIARPRSASASTATARARRRRRGMSSFAICLGTFLHLMSLILGCGSQRRSERCDIAGWLSRRRRVRQRQRDGHGGSFVDLALHGQLAGMQPDQGLHDRQPEAGAFVPPLIGLAGLEEGSPIRLRSSAAMPTPVSVTRNTSRDPSTPAETVTLPPRSVNLMALDTRFSTICLNARASPFMTGKSSGTRVTRSIPFSRAFRASRLQQLLSAARGANGSGAISKLPDSILDISRM